jgi:hypothetical protein
MSLGKGGERRRVIGHILEYTISIYRISQEKVNKI